MRKFLLNTSVFILILAVFNIAIFFVAQHVYYKEYQFRPNKKFKSFILSDSHGKCLKNYGEPYSIYNFSAKSESVLDMNRKLKYLIANGFEIETIYFSVDDHILSPHRYKYNNLDRSIFYSNVQEFKSYYQYLINRFIKYYVPIFHAKVRLVFKSLLVSKVTSLLFGVQDGFKKRDWIYLSDSERRKQAVERFKIQFSYQNSNEELTASFLEIISICKSENINLIGVKFPLSRNLIAVLGNSNYGADSILKANGFPVLDHKLDFENKDEYFYDADHINDIGGEVLSQKLFLNIKN
jgi:hypothetical protein